jgi:hypothetical protein
LETPTFSKHSDLDKLYTSIAMLAKLPDYFISHPTIPTKETCKACLSHLQVKKQDIQNDKCMKESQRQKELLKKDGQSRRFPSYGLTTLSTDTFVSPTVKRLYWRKGTRAERVRHLANCAHQTRRVREEAQLERSKKGSSETPAAEDDGPGPMSHFKAARDNPRPRATLRPSARPSRASSSTTTSYQEDSDDEAFEEMIATGEHARYLEDLKVEQQRAEKRARREQLEAEQTRKGSRTDVDEDEDEGPEYVVFVVQMGLTLFSADTAIRITAIAYTSANPEAHRPYKRIFGSERGIKSSIAYFDPA